MNAKTLNLLVDLIIGYKHTNLRLTFFDSHKWYIDQ